jgi:formylglycine-generating enzyme required for sulfatase activity
VFPKAEHDERTGRLLVLYREHADPGLHAAIDWLLRQKWGKGEALARIDAELTRQALSREVPVSTAPLGARGKDWYVNSEGQTFAVVRAPVEFTVGSPETEPGRVEGTAEPAHQQRIEWAFAIATKEVTTEQFLRFRPNHEWVKRYSPGPDTPAMSMSWYEAAEFCNWLSRREGIPRDQWCYEPNREGKYAEGMLIRAGHLKLTGYRLPTEAEWEYACRGGAVTSRYYGRGEELLPRYGWFGKNADDRARPVGVLRPNEVGLFDMLGNAMEWCEDRALLYVPGQKEEIENSLPLQIIEQKNRMIRGGAFIHRPNILRSANRMLDRPGFRNWMLGFRPARTLPD